MTAEVTPEPVKRTMSREALPVMRAEVDSEII